MKKQIKRFGKVFIFSMILLSMLGLSFRSSATMLDDDASIVYNTRQPISYKGWLAPVHNATGTTDSYQDSYWTGSMSGSSSSYLWRLSNYFDTPTNETLLNPRTIIGWEYDSTLDFNVDYVYQFNIQIRYDGSSASVPLADFSKVLLCFSSNSILFNTHTFNNATAVQYLKNSFAPASYTISGKYVELIYNVPIYPSTMFADIDIQVDNGIDYIPISGLFIWNQGAGDISFTIAPNGTYQRYQTVVFPRNNMPAKIFTPDQWASHVEEQGFSDLSKKIDQQTGEIVSAIDNQTSEIVGSIEDATDAILDAGQPFDMEDFDQAHEVESETISDIFNLVPYDHSVIVSASTFFGASAAVNALNNWFTSAVQNNLWIQQIVFGAIAMATIFMVFKAVM